MTLLVRPRSKRSTTPSTSPFWVALRAAWAIVTVFVIESLLLAFAILPAAVFYQWHLNWALSPWWVRGVLLGAATVPAYFIFAVLLMALSAMTCRVLGWRPVPGLVMPLAEWGWPLLDWARYSVVSHVVRLLAGSVLRATPIWTWYLRLDGARLGRGVWVNSLGVTDHCLLEFGDGVVIGAGAHLSGHTSERGAIRTGTITLGARTTIGVNTIVGIGVTTGPGCQVGALSYVPKDSHLEGSTAYGGVPVRALTTREDFE
jgi:acetyltransferase-like isoleucine patch superfamily enzyme